MSLLVVLFPDCHFTLGSEWTANGRKLKEKVSSLVCVFTFGMELGKQNELGFMELMVPQLNVSGEKSWV